VPQTVTTTLTTSATTSTITPSPTAVSDPFTLSVAGSASGYDGYRFTYNGCPSGMSGQPYIYIGGEAGTSFVFGSDGYLHVKDCFNVIAGVFADNDPAVLFFVDPKNPGTNGFVPSPCSSVPGQNAANKDLTCTGVNGETVFYFPYTNYGVLSELYFGNQNFGVTVEVRID
jgi:hypothetical protein